MQTGAIKRPAWVYAAATVLAIILVVTAWRVSLILPPTENSDAQGRVEELAQWTAGGPHPAPTRGPLHFYLLRLAQRLNISLRAPAWPDIITAGLFLFFYVLFLSRAFDPWIAVGSAAAAACHLFTLKFAADASGFFLFFLLLFVGLTFLTHDDPETPLPAWRAALGGAWLSLAGFARFEAAWFVVCVMAWLLSERRWRASAWFAAAWLATFALGLLVTYVSLDAMLFAGRHVVHHSPAAAIPSLADFTRYLAGAFGAAPLVAALAGALWSLRERPMRPWASMFLLAMAATTTAFVAGRFQYDQDRYYLVPLVWLLPFAGWTIGRVWPRGAPAWRAAGVWSMYAVGAAFYLRDLWLELRLWSGG